MRPWKSPSSASTPPPARTSSTCARLGSGFYDIRCAIKSPPTRLSTSTSSICAPLVCWDSAHKAPRVQQLAFGMVIAAVLRVHRVMQNHRRVIAFAAGLLREMHAMCVVHHKLPSRRARRGVRTHAQDYHVTSGPHGTKAASASAGACLGCVALRCRSHQAHHPLLAPARSGLRAASVQWQKASRPCQTALSPTDPHHAPCRTWSRGPVADIYRRIAHL